MIIMFIKEDENLVREFKDLVDSNAIEDIIEGESLSGDEWVQIIVMASGIISSNVVQFLIHHMVRKKTIVRDNSGRIIEARDADDAIKLIRALSEQEKTEEK